jgi:hypothetical protein
MFQLIKPPKSADGLALVEDLTCYAPDLPYTHIQYYGDDDIWIGEIGLPPGYFSSRGYQEYLADHIAEFKFQDGYAVDRLVKIPMLKVIRPITVESLQSQIAELKKEISNLSHVIFYIQDICDIYKMLHDHEYPTWLNNLKDINTLKPLKIIKNM